MSKETDEDKYPEHTAKLRRQQEKIRSQFLNIRPPNWIEFESLELFFGNRFRYKHKNFRYSTINGERIILVITLRGSDLSDHPAANPNLSKSRWNLEIRAYPYGEPKDSPRASSKSLSEFRDWFFELLEPLPDSFQEVKKLTKLPEYWNHQKASGMMLFVKEWNGVNFDSLVNIIDSIWSHIDEQISSLDPKLYFYSKKNHTRLNYSMFNMLDEEFDDVLQ